MEFKDNQPIYIQIADYFCENILLKKWKEGEKIPSVRQVAVTMEVNPNTALRTFNYLQNMGIIFNKRGIGYFVDDNAYLKTLELKKEKFVNTDLPFLFKTIKMLNISIDELGKLFLEYNNNK
ncbi:MAG: GntR family transcriptional regulator [Bacteroidales bacterium]|nr:GntR family transcriptional regulator [Bacteroidales bacterium]